jgi:ATP-dependent Clp protease ATP-binding subunit ClpB
LKGLQQMLKNQSIDLEFTPFALEYLVDQGFDPQFGARPLKRVIQKEIINLLSKKIIAGDIDKDKKVIVDVFDGMVVLRNK